MTVILLLGKMLPNKAASVVVRQVMLPAHTHTHTHTYIDTHIHAHTFIELWEVEVYVDITYMHLGRLYTIWLWYMSLLVLYVEGIRCVSVCVYVCVCVCLRMCGTSVMYYLSHNNYVSVEAVY